ncbi:MAG: chaperone protein dnaJ 1, mitochondrial isoform [Polaromonas sp.]|nr:chaperone protein dnaJ 1, mitochondrial isoform [Polaromonas sp.]
MTSAYSLLGVPGNASKEDIEEAFAAVEAYYSGEKMGADPRAADRFRDVKDAYMVLRDSESRAAHDRKLNGFAKQRATASARPRSPVVIARPPGWGAFTYVTAALVAIAIGVVVYFNAKKETAIKEQAALELKAKQLAVEQKNIEALKLATDEEYRAKLLLIEERKDQQFRQESVRAIVNARNAEAQRSYQDAALQAAEDREAQRKIYEARAQEQNAARTAQQRLALDKARIRELCYQNYRRHDC